MTMLLAPAAGLHAQLITPTAARPYAGPRFPGGPDSLRAWLQRHPLPQAGRTPVFVQFDVLPSDPLHEPHVIVPPGSRTLPAAVATAALHLVAEMPTWTPGRQDVEIPITTVTLCLSEASLALAYADEMPAFPDIEPGIIGFYRYMPGIQVVTPQILQKKLAGDVYVYFEVSPAGHLENACVIGGTVPALNDAALRTVARLPTRARTPARLRGWPVRVYYVLSVGFAVDPPR